MRNQICILLLALSMNVFVVACDDSSDPGRDDGGVTGIRDAAHQSDGNMDAVGSTDAAHNDGGVIDTMDAFYPSDGGMDVVRYSDSGMDAAVAPGTGDGAADIVCERRVLVDDVTNARDLGGWPLSGGGRVACRKVFRGGTLDALSDAGCADFAALGIRTIVDLREAIIQQVAPPSACATVNASYVSAPMTKLLPDTPENYLALLDETEAIRVIFGVLGDATSYPVYYGCEIGRARASFITALILLALGLACPTYSPTMEVALIRLSGSPMVVKNKKPSSTAWTRFGRLLSRYF